MASSLAYVYLLVGLLLGATSRSAALAVLVGWVTVTASLPWQLGVGNLAYPLLYLVGLIIGTWVAGTRRAFQPETRRPSAPRDPVAAMRMACGAAVLCVFVASALALARSTPVFYPVALVDLGGALSGLAAFNPGGFAGFVQGMTVPIAGILLFLIAVEVLTEERARRRLRSALVFGCAVCVASPLLQALVLDPTVRPDKGTSHSVGWVAFFQDPHSLAAYLVLLLGVVLGLVFQRLDRPSSYARIVHLSLVLGTAVVLLFTNSRSGLVSSFACVMVFGSGYVVFGDPDLTHAARNRRAKKATAGVALVVIAILATLSITPARAGIYRGLSRLGNPRMWQFINPEGPEEPLLGRRFLHWQKAGRMIMLNPVWGVGPAGYVRTQLEPSPDSLAEYLSSYGEVELERALLESRTENAHNYFLQYAAEFGLPALATLLSVVVLMLVTTARGLRTASRCRRALLLGILAGETGFLLMCLVGHPLLLAEMQAAFWTVGALGVAEARSTPVGAVPAGDRLE